MSEEKEQYKRLTREELDKIAGEPLPERAAMSLINANRRGARERGAGTQRAQ